MTNLFLMLAAVGDASGSTKNIQTLCISITAGRRKGSNHRGPTSKSTGCCWGFYRSKIQRWILKMVVWDPPHIVRLGNTSWMSRRYGMLGKNWKKALRAGF